MGKFAKLTVSGVEKLTEDAVAIRFDVPAEENNAFRFVPGQYLTVQSDISGETVRRSYSICCTPADGLRIGVKRVDGGRFSGFAQELSAGDVIDVMPPEGRFVCDPAGQAARNVLLIAAGSGITPILSIAASLLEGSKDSNVTLLFGNQRTSSIMFRQEIEDLKDRFLNRFHVFHFISREAQDVELFHGRIDVERVRKLTGLGIINPADSDGIFLCGPAEMTLSLAKHFEETGIEARKIHTELFEAPDATTPPRISEKTRAAAQEGINIEVVLDGLHQKFVLSDPSQTVLQAAASSGLDLPFSCAGGMCATCRCRMVEGEGEMDRNFSLDDWELEAGFVLACQLRPKSQSLKLDFDAT